MSENIESLKSVNRIWHIINIIGMAMIAISVIVGLYLLIQTITTNVAAGMGMRVPGGNFIGLISGLMVMIQGSIAGVLLIAFSKLGESVNRIEISLSQRG
ncbi:hypothetical protein DYD21_15330 [Rhodohalobacter sp. SW132]|uniref:hypothetical protein n=1 Tax=Rhodohalobacter sp. SW132 TaxID=2293433 RepID=UPI000E249175|nr:hypothetical protein [Rhodohalobacter sp. SW132]REL29217.1 hypothetical protein DYD21_15330 [Rhodohalobacter sp. SW132]